MVSLKDFTEKIIRFRDERDWKKYHTPKNLAISLVIEVGELFEHFQWRSDEEILENCKNLEIQERIGDELADIVIYTLLLSNKLGIDLEKAILEKIKKNEEKYPIELVKGNYKKYRELTKYE